jgi:hypothetical protein
MALGGNFTLLFLSVANLIEKYFKIAQTIVQRMP